MKLPGKIDNYVQTVRGRTEEEKKKAVITWTIVITILVFIIWAITFSLSVINRQAENDRLRQEAEARVLASTTMGTVIQTNESWGVKFGKLITGSVDLVTDGFWTVGGWLHK